MKKGILTICLALSLGFAAGGIASVRGSAETTVNTFVTGESGKAVMLSYYVDDDDCEEPFDVQLDFIGSGETFDMILLDGEHDAEFVQKVKSGETVTLLPNTGCLLKTE